MPYCTICDEFVANPCSDEDEDSDCPHRPEVTEDQGDGDERIDVPPPFQIPGIPVERPHVR
jgi:hypothetical protein